MSNNAATDRTPRARRTTDSRTSGVDLLGDQFRVLPQVVRAVEQRMRLQPLCSALPGVMQQRVAAAGFRLGQIIGGVKEQVRPPEVA